MENPGIGKKVAAEFIGTFWLVFGGCGTAIFSAKAIGDLPNHMGQWVVGVGYLGVALAFGLTVVTGAYAFGHISGGHFNPAVTLGTAVGGRTEWKDVPFYWVSQVLGGLAAGGLLFAIASGQKGWDRIGNMAANGYDSHSPSGYNLMSALLIEVVLTAVFIWVIMGATDVRAPQGFGPLAIGLTLTLIHLISIPVTNTSVNPARSTAVAFFNGDGAPGQLWLFWLAPLAGAAVAGITYTLLFGSGASHSEDIEEGQDEPAVAPAG